MEALPVRVTNVAGIAYGPDPGILFAKPVPSGTYQGLFFETPTPAPEASGFVQAKISSSGRSISGKATILRQTYAFSGTISPDHSIALITSPSRAGDRLELELQILTENGSPQLAGTIGNQSWQVPLRANRAAYNSKSVAPQAGNYTLALVNTNMPVTNGYPHGHGYATVLVKPAGDVRLRGATAIGRSISCVGKLSSTGEWPLYVPTGKSGGFIISWVTVTTNTDGAIPARPIYWSEPPLATAGAYADGFDLSLQGIGSTFEVITSEAEPSFDKGVAVMSGGELLTGVTPESQCVNVSSVPPKAWRSVEDTKKFNASVKQSSGVTSGSFRNLTTGEAAPIKGILLQQQQAIYGYFLSGGASGSMTITAGGW
jgi:hypothetical protein